MKNVASAKDENAVVLVFFLTCLNVLSLIQLFFLETLLTVIYALFLYYLRRLLISAVVMYLLLKQEWLTVTQHTCTHITNEQTVIVG